MKRLWAVILVLLCFVQPLGLAAEPPLVSFLEAADDGLALPDDGVMEVHLLSIGWADCQLVRVGDVTMLVDAGNVETGEDVVAYLRGIGVDALDYVFLTHFHNDHIGGMLAVLEALPVG